LFMAPSSQSLEPPQKPGRFSLCIQVCDVRGLYKAQEVSLVDCTGLQFS
jgi:hypothetical protein